jgi:hypothetical protein
VYNARVSLFNALYNQEDGNRQSGADDDMVMEAAKARYRQKAGHEFRLFHWWQVVRNQPKWSRKHGGGPSIDVSKRSRLGSSGEYTSGSRETDEEVSRPMGRDRAKAAARKGKGTASSSDVDSSSMSGTGSMLKNLCKVSKRFVTAKMFREWNKMKDRSTDNMTASEKRVHERALARLEKELALDEDEEEAAAEEEEDDDE